MYTFDAYKVRNELSFGFPYYFRSYDEAMSYYNEDPINRRYPDKVKTIQLDNKYYLLTPIEFKDLEDKRAKALAKLTDEDIEVLGL